MADETPKLQVDSDWKAQAEAERERLRKTDEKAQSDRQSRPRDAEGLPPADFRSIVGVLASQAVMGLGAYADPQSGRVVIDLVGSKFAIDLLGVLEEKTKGNLSKEEVEELALTLQELRARFVAIASRLAAAAAPKEGAQQAAPGAAKPGIILPG